MDFIESFTVEAEKLALKDPVKTNQTFSKDTGGDFQKKTFTGFEKKKTEKRFTAKPTGSPLSGSPLMDPEKRKPVF